MLRERFGVSERRACTVVGLHRSTMRLAPTPMTTEEAELRAWLADRLEAAGKAEWARQEFAFLVERAGVDPFVREQRLQTFQRPLHLADRLRGDGATVIFVGVDGRGAGIIAIADPVKATTAEAIRDLKASGLRLVMMTGDNRTTAEAVARRLGIVDVSVMPANANELETGLQALGWRIPESAIEKEGTT